MKRSRPTLSLAVMLVAAGMLLPGCWDRREVEDTGFVLAMGLDRAPDGQVAVTVQIAIPREVGGGQAGQGGPEGARPVLVERVVQPTVTEAMRNLETFTSRRISFVQLKTVIFGRELAEDGVTTYIGILTRNREMRRSMLLMVAEKSAEEILAVKPALEREPSSFLEDLTRRARETTGQAPRRHLHDFLKAYESLARAPTLPIVRIKESGPGLNHRPDRKLQLLGTAIFRQGRMIGELTPEESEVLMLLSGSSASFFESAPLPGRPGWPMIVSLESAGRKAKGIPGDRRARLKLDLVAEGELRQAERAPQVVFTPQGIRELESILEKQLERESVALIHKLQTEFRSDAMGLGDAVQSQFLDWPSWARYNWPARFPEAEVGVSVRIHIRRVGMTFQPTVPVGGSDGE